MATPAERIEAAIAALAVALRKVSSPSMFIGGIAAIAHGVPRLTRDIDATVVGQGIDLHALLEILAAHGIVPRIGDAVAFACESQVLLLQHAPGGVEIDISLAWLPFELEAIASAIDVTLAGETVRLARPEDLVIYKFTAWRPQDRQDIERLLALHGAHMDLSRVRRLSAEIAEVLDEPERLATFETLLGSTRPS